MQRIYQRVAPVPTLTHICLLVEPLGEFHPRDWRYSPEKFLVKSVEAVTAFRGTADANKFMKNQEVWRQQNADGPDEWMIVLSIEECQTLGIDVYGQELTA